MTRCIRWSVNVVGRVLALAAVASLAAPVTWAENHWAQWRGPLASGAAPSADPPVNWSETTNVKWKAKLPGHGTGTPIVWEDRIYLQAAIPQGPRADAPAQEQQRGAGSQAGRQRGGFGAAKPTIPYRFVLLCLDRATGKLLWEKVVREEIPHEGHHRDHGFASHSPVTDGKHVYAYFGSRGLYCFDRDGNEKWRKDLGKMTTKNSFGEGSSPALHGDVLVVNWDHEGADFIAAFDKITGQERWRQDRNEDTTWATPLIVEHEGKAQVVTAATGKIRSYDLATGKQIWEAAGLTPNAIPSPVAAEGVVYLMSGFRGNRLVAIRLGGAGDLTGSNAILWEHNRNTPYVPSPLLYDGRLYFLASNNGVLSCFDAGTGKSLYGPERIAGLGGVYASPVGAAGRIYLVGRDGVAVVLKAGDKPEILATNKLDERIDASPALVDKELFLRGHESLYCIAER